MIKTEIKEYIEREIIPRYAAFDRAHNVDHAQTVIAESAALAAHFPQVDEQLVYIIAAFHDTGLCEGRERHHIVSGEIVRGDKFICSHLSAQQIDTVCDAIEDHRASSKSEPRTIYGRIVAEADRVISVDTTLRRTVQYGLKQLGECSAEQHFERFNDHLQKKYARGGYIKLYIPHSGNAAKLEELRTIIENPTLLRHHFDRLFEEEKALL